ncbi:SCO family protein [Burkholderiaceae bacterium DAT-1]|nr:SCO family protein [Burkholderiaceae bacterium DAT-1]
MKRLIATAVLALSAMLAHAEPAAPSIFDAKLPLVDQEGKSFELAKFKGQPMVMTMFYGNCKVACPMTLHALHEWVDGLSQQERDKLKVVMVSLDPAHDTPASLVQVAGMHHLEGNPWVLAVTDASHTRTLSAMLDIRYRQLADGEINHSMRLVLVDGQGAIVDATEDLQTLPDTAFSKHVRQMLGN